MIHNKLFTEIFELDNVVALSPTGKETHVVRQMCRLYADLNSICI